MLPPLYPIRGFRKNSANTLLIGSGCLRLFAAFHILNLARRRKTLSCSSSVVTDRTSIRFPDMLYVSDGRVVVPACRIGSANRALSSLRQNILNDFLQGVACDGAYLAYDGLEAARSQGSARRVRSQISECVLQSVLFFLG